MGVRGLTTFIASNDRKYLKSHKLYNTFVIIDGNSLACQLFALRASRVFFAFGGDYDRYAQYIREFFQMLAHCNVRPIVVFDGGYERKKLKTVIKRLQDRSAMLKHVKPASNSAAVVFPLLMRQVFRQVLLEMGVPIVQCDFESDQEIASLGRKYNCPVISYDSDFFIYDVQYIPIPTIEHELRPVNFSFNNASSEMCIHCKIFKVEHFLDSFGGMDKSMLPLLSALLGNDYVKLSVFKKFHTQLKTPKGKSGSGQKRAARVIEWLRNQDCFDSALQRVLSRMKRIERRNISKKIKETVSIYNCDKLTVERYMPLELINTCPTLPPEPLKIPKMIDDVDLDGSDVEIDDLNPETSSGDSGDSEDSELETISAEQLETQSTAAENEDMDVDEGPNNSQVEPLSRIPSWLLDKCRRGFIDTILFDILTLKTCFSTPQIEDKYLTPSHEVSTPLLRALIKIILGDIEVKINHWARNKSCFIQRYHLKPLNVDLPNLENVIEHSPESRRSILLSLLDVPGEFCIDIFPDEWKLYLCTILYWIKNTSSPSITDIHVKSLCLCLIALNIIDNKLGFIREKMMFLKKCGKTFKRLLRTRKNENDVESDFNDEGDDLDVGIPSNSEFLEENTSAQSTSHELSHLLSNISTDDCILCFESFLKFHKLKEELKSDPKLFSYPDIHAFAQFQNCLHNALILNSLLMFPLKQCMIHTFYSGTFIYNVCSTLNDSKNVNEVVQSLLGNSPKLFEVFTTLVSVISSAVPSLVSHTKKSRTRKRKRSRKNRTENVDVIDDCTEHNTDAEEDEYCDENNMFSLLSNV